MREYDAPAYYHVYNRGSGERFIFRDAIDRHKFLSLLQRYLSNNSDFDAYPTFDMELLAFCVMGNHYHLLLFQEYDSSTISQLMRSVSTAYSMYFNLRHKTHGHVFQSVFKASRITNDTYLAHISRYIHMNPETYKTYKWSSLPYYLGRESADWIKPERILDMSPKDYLAFLEDYEDRKQTLNLIKSQMAS